MSSSVPYEEKQQVEERLKQRLVRVSEEDRKSFIKAFVEGKPFKKWIPILGGTIELLFRELTPNEVRYIGMAVQFGETSQMDGMFIASIEQVKFNKNVLKDREDITFDSILAKDKQDSQYKTTLPERFQVLSSRVFRTIDEFLRAEEAYIHGFVPLVRELYREAENPDFFSKMNTT